MTAEFHRVLVGYDGSEPAHDALALATRLVDDQDGELLLARVDEQRGFRRRPGQLGAAAEVLSAGLASLPAGLRRRGIERAAASAARGLHEAADVERADLIVLGAHDGPRGRATPGPTALRLIAGAQRAVAIAPLGLRERERLHHVGVAYDASGEAANALAVAYELALREHAALSIFRAIPHISADPYAGLSASRAMELAALSAAREAQDDLDEAADRAPAGLNPRTVLIHGNPLEIAQACDGIVDLLVVGSHGYGPMQRALAGSVSRALLRASTQPVLVVPRVNANADVNDRGIVVGEHADAT